MTDISSDEINCLENLQHLIKPLIQRNFDLSAQNYMDLGQKDSVTMKIDAGDVAPIKT